MEVHEIEVTIGVTGEVRIQVRDMKGSSCLIATSDLEQMLGGEIVERTRTGSDDEPPFLLDKQVKSQKRIGE
jgi:hypothetical protein